MRAAGVFAILLVSAAAAWAEDAPVRERQPVPEPSREWADWSRQFAADLLVRRRNLEAAEEMYAAALFDRNEVDLLCDAAVLVVDGGASKPIGIKPGSPYEIFAGQCIALAISRGAGPADPPPGAQPGPNGEPPVGKTGDARLAYALGRLAWARQDFGVAGERFREAFDGGFDRVRSLDWYFRGAVNASVSRYQNGRLDEGIADIERVLELAPQHPERIGALINLADGYRRRQEPVPALAILEDLVKEHPNIGESWFTYGLLLKDQGDAAGAADALQRGVDALARDGKDFASPLIARVEVLQKLARFAEAEAEMQRYLVLRPDEPEGIYRLSRIRRDAGDLDDAVRLARRALRLEKDSVRFLENLRALLHRRGLAEDAAELAEVTARYEKRIAELDAERAGTRPQPKAPTDGVPPDDGAEQPPAPPEDGDR